MLWVLLDPTEKLVTWSAKRSHSWKQARLHKQGLNAEAVRRRWEMQSRQGKDGDGDGDGRGIESGSAVVDIEERNVELGPPADAAVSSNIDGIT